MQNLVFHVASEFRDHHSRPHKANLRSLDKKHGLSQFHVCIQAIL